MPESELRAVLLQQDGPANIAAELTLLNELVRSEHRRAHRLRFWTIVVWATFVTIVVAMIAAKPLFLKRVPDGPQVIIPAPHEVPSFTENAVVVLVCLMLLGLVTLPFVGIVLLILMISAQRSATLTQLRASVASIDAQLKLLAATQPNKS